MVLGQGLRLALVGMALGVGASPALTRLLSKMLFGVKCVGPGDVCRSGGGVDGGGARSVLDTSATRDAGRSGDCAAVRVRTGVCGP